ncbi:MAG: FkbM family methyltransferase [Chloroflexi bacterium]|nr:FkbM family methyltransferase [Chloroflexota bacterium]
MRYRVMTNFRAPIIGGWEPQAQRLMVRHVAPGSVAYDIGANIGIHTLLLSRLVGRDGQVYAFEPVPALYDRLCENVRLNRSLPAARPVQLALGEQSGTAAFYTGHHAGAGHLAASGPPIGDRIDVTTRVLDEFVYRDHHAPPGFVKIDVEGAEGSVLAGAEQVLSNARPIVMVDLHTPTQDLAVGKSLSRAGYVVYRTGDGSQVRDLERGWPDPDGLSGQVIAFPVERG